MTTIRPSALARIGSPDAAASIAHHLDRVAQGLTVAAHICAPDDAAWIGPAAFAFRETLALQPRAFEAAAAACHSVAIAMARHAAVLAEARTLIDHADALFRADQATALVLADRAATTSSTSACRAASHIELAASAAPSRPSVVAASMRKAAEWRAEVGLGASEGLESLLGLSVRLNPARLLRAPHDTATDAAATASAGAHAIRHPRQAIRHLTDWDTWTTNPARAIGHTVPDLLAAAATGGASASTRAATIAARTRASVTEAAVADAARRATLQATAATARRRLVHDALSRGRLRATHTAQPPWRGDGGASLRARDAAAADAYWRLNATVEPAVTAQIRRLADDVGARLAGLEHRLKEPDSLKRKLATKQTDKGLAIDQLLEGAEDTVRYTLVLEESTYVDGVKRAATQLDRAGYHRLELNNAWYSGRYRGINSTWVHPQSGTAFEVQFHTPKSWQITRETHPMYEVMRLGSTALPEKQALSAIIAAEYRKAPHPRAVATVTEATFPPPTPPGPIVVPPDHTLVAATTGAAATRAAGAAGAASPASHHAAVGVAERDARRDVVDGGGRR